MKKIFVFFSLFIIIIMGCTVSTGKYSSVKATVYKEPTCGCCVGYSSFLKQQGFDVNIVEMKDMNLIKKKYNIPKSMESCHTTVIGEYFIEGHVPIEALNKLLTEKPKVEGIALPNMPSGTPGMPGVKRRTYNVYSLIEGEISDFIQI